MNKAKFIKTRTIEKLTHPENKRVCLGEGLENGIDLLEYRNYYCKGFCNKEFTVDNDEGDWQCGGCPIQEMYNNTVRLAEIEISPFGDMYYDKANEPFGNSKTDTILIPCERKNVEELKRGVGDE